MKPFNQINVIPFIDIMLVLLAIVLTTASFVSQGLIDVTLPEAETAMANTENKQSVEIVIDAMKKIYFSDQEVTDVQLQQQLQTLKKDTAITLRVDQTATFKQFVFIVDLLKKYQLENVSILTRKRNAT